MTTIKYAKSHEWVSIEGNIATVGITKHAADALGELVYVENPESDEVEAGDSIAVIESSKSASDVYTPVEGKVIEFNEKLEDNPELINEITEDTANYGDSWIVKIEVSKDVDLSSLLDEKEYKAEIQ